MFSRITGDSEVESILAANQAFYDAFEARDLDAMSDLWEHSERAACTHPGWTTLRGWAPIVSSFAAIFRNQASLQFVLTEVVPTVNGDTGWVTVDENLLGDQGGATVAAINVFARSTDGWKLVVHQGSPVHLSRA